MTTSPAPFLARPNRPRSDATDDVGLVLSLSRVLFDLRRSRQEVATAGSPRSRANAGHLETILKGKSRVLTTRRGAEEPGEPTIEVAAGAVANGQRESTILRAALSDNAASVLERLSRTIGGLEREAAELRASLSLPALRAVELLERKSRLPLVSWVDGGACSECHLRLPTSLACSFASEAVERCPTCKRVLIADGRTS